MNKKIVIALVVIGLVIAGVYAIINASKQPKDVVEKTTLSLYGKWKLDTSQQQKTGWIDSANLYATTLNFESDSTAIISFGKDSSIKFAYSPVSDTFLLKEKDGVEKTFTYKLQDSLLQVRSVADSSTIYFKQVK